MSEAQITLQGWLGADADYDDKGDVSRCRLRVGTTPRRFDKESGQWVDGETQWYSVVAWRQLADNCGRSLKRGDPVVVQGRMKAQIWTNRSGVDLTTFEVEASVVGHDLTRGTSVFTRNPAPVTAGSPATAPATAPSAAAATPNPARVPTAA